MRSNQKTWFGSGLYRLGTVWPWVKLHWASVPSWQNGEKNPHQAYSLCGTRGGKAVLEEMGEEFYKHVSYPRLCTQESRDKVLWQLWFTHTNLHIVLNKCLLNWKALKITWENNLPCFSSYEIAALCERALEKTLYCDPPLWGKNQLSHIRAGCSGDQLPGMGTGTRPDTFAEGPLLSVPPQPFSNSLSWSRSRPPMEGTTDHPRTGSGSPGKAHKARGTQYMQHSTSGEETLI